MILQLDAGVADDVASRHMSAAKTIDGAAAAAPGTVDAGVGTLQIVDILLACSGTAADLAGLNLAFAEMVQRVAVDLSATDGSIAADFAVRPGARP